MFRYWYCGLGSSTGWQIGYATSPLTYAGNVAATSRPGPTAFELGDSYPNPFNPETRIEYSIPRDEHVLLKVYDVLGQEVATLVDEFRAAGKHAALLNGLHLSSGVYWYRLTAGDYTAAKKMVLAK
jgi:hypothetical protein